MSKSPKLSMVEEMREARSKRLSVKAPEQKPAHEGGVPPSADRSLSKRFGWKENIVNAPAPKGEDFHRQPPAAPQLASTGTLAPIDLKSTRRMVAQARAAKKKDFK